MSNDLSEKFRHHFPVFNNVTYINSCSQGALSNQVRASMNQYMDGMEAIGSDWNAWVTTQEEVRGLLAKIFHTSADQVALTGSASASINSLMSAFDFENGKKKIVTTDLEFPTMGQILHAQERRGVEIVHVETDENYILDLAKFDKAIDENTALVAVTHVCYRNGATNDIASIVKLAHSKGVPVLVDAYQSVGSRDINFEELGADFLIGGVLKYLLSMPGLGFMLVNKNSKLVPIDTGWFAAKDIFAMKIDKYEPAIDARRFESGTPPVPSLYAAKAGLALMLEVGTANAYEHSKMLHEQLRAGVLEMGGKVATPADELHRGVMLGVKSTDEHKLVDAMAAEKIIISCRDGNIRVSPHFYNNATDIDKCLAAFAKNKNLLA